MHWEIRNLILCFCTVLSLNGTHQFFKGPTRNKRSDITEIDECTSGVELSETNVPGVCNTFDDNACMCELNANCRYDQDANTCIETTDCTIYNNNAIVCRAVHCQYDCKTGMCRNGGGSTGTCSAGDKNQECQQLCGNICDCKARGCQFSPDGKCKNMDPVCSNSIFRSTQCGRLNGYYLNKGHVCKNTKQRGNCKIHRTNIAVNLGGPTTTDRHGITYDAERNHKYVDKQKIRLEYKLASDVIETVSTEERTIYETIVYSDSSKRENGRCLRYNIPICGDGDYELIIKTMGISKVNSEEKAFNILLGDHYIFAELDVMSIAKERNKGIDLILNFKVQNKVMIAEGIPVIHIRNGSVPLSFCFGECTFFDGNFEVAAFAVNKFVNIHSQNQPDSYCNQFNEDHWGCVNAFCYYNKTGGICSSVETKELACNEVCNSALEVPIVEMLFVLDSTSSSYAESASTDYSLVFDRFQEIVNVADLIQKIYPRSKFGIALFSDYSCTTNWKPCFPGSKYENVPVEGCYRRHSPLNEDLSYLKSRAKRYQLTTHPSRSQEPGLFGTMMAVEDYRTNFSYSYGSDYFKMVVLITDDSLHMENPQKTRPPRFDGTDTCQHTIHPTPYELGNFLRGQQISMFLITDTAQNANSYTNVFYRMNIPYGYGWLSDSTVTTTQYLINFIDKNAKLVR